MPLGGREATLLADAKRALTRAVWNERTSAVAEPRTHGINRGYRLVGGPAKTGGLTVRAWRSPYPKMSAAQIVSSAMPAG